MTHIHYEINFIVEVTYKLKTSNAAMVRVVALVTILLCFISDLIFLATVIIPAGFIQVILMRSLMGFWILIGIFYAIAILYFGAKIEALLKANEQLNEKEIKAVRLVRYAFAMIIFTFGLMFYPLFMILPVLMNWLFPLSLSTVGVPLFYFWEMKIIKKKMGIETTGSTRTTEVSSDKTKEQISGQSTQA